jgi:hypothetical protein
MSRQAIIWPIRFARVELSGKWLYASKTTPGTNEGKRNCTLYWAIEIGSLTTIACACSGSADAASAHSKLTLNRTRIRRMTTSLRA